MESLLFIILEGAAAAYISSIFCRLMQLRHKKAGWYLGVIGAAGAGVITLILIYQGDLLHPSRWDVGKANLGFLIPFCFAMSSAAGLVPALSVVAYFRSKFKDSKPAHHLSPRAGHD